jgi:ATP-dependent Lhr-like helicase
MWHGAGTRRGGPDALLDVIEQLQGAPIAASILESEILRARLPDYSPEWLDTLAAAGEVVWIGLEALGHRDGRIALYLADRVADLAPAPSEHAPDDEEQVVLDWLAAQGASFFGALHTASGGGYPGDVVETLWRLVWARRITNDAFHALRARVQPAAKPSRSTPRPAFRSRRLVPHAAEGRWSLVDPRRGRVSNTARMAATARQLLARHGILTREAVAAEGFAGGFSALYPALKAMDDAGQLRRGYFISGLGATQFALPGALDLLRGQRDADPDAAVAIELSATDPASPFGASLPWPFTGASRVVGAAVILVDGDLAAFIPRGRREILVALPEDEPRRGRVARAVAASIAASARRGAETPRGMYIESINGEPAPGHPLSGWLVEAGFVRAGTGLHMPLRASRPVAAGADA